MTIDCAPLKNEDGYLMILATLMILVLLTILGVAASRTANTELAVAANEMVYQRNFYLAEGAALQAVDILTHQNDLKDNPSDWFDTVPGAMTENNVDAYWDEAGISDTLDTTGNTRYVAGVENAALGSSLDMDKPRVYSIGVYGRCQRNGVTMVKVGYLKVY
jgi:hypothetical protein